MDMITDVKRWITQNFFRRVDGASVSAGAQDAGRPVVLNAVGRVDSSLIVGSYTAGAPAATGYVTIKVNGVTYKILVST